jgi:glycine reductase
VISKELDRAGFPVALISAMYPVAEQIGASRIIKAVAIPHPCGDPSLSGEMDFALRREIVTTALKALETEVEMTTIFSPKMAVSS